MKSIIIAVALVASLCAVGGLNAIDSHEKGTMQACWLCGYFGWGHSIIIVQQGGWPYWDPLQWLKDNMSNQGYFWNHFSGFRWPWNCYTQSCNATAGSTNHG